MSKIKMHINLLCFFMLCLCYTPTFGQSKLLEATITKQNGTIEKGYIHTPKHKLTSHPLVFSKSPMGKKEHFTAVDVEKFTIGDRVFQGNIMTIDKKPIAKNKLTLTDTLNYQLDTFFMEEVTRGSLSLYEYIDKDLKKHYIAKTINGTYKELPFQRKLVLKLDPQTGFKREVIQEWAGFKATLDTLMADCSSIGVAILKSSYYRKSLAKVFEAYYACQGETNALIHQQIDGGIKFSITAGASAKQVNYGLGYGAQQFPRLVRPVLGVSTEWALRGPLAKFSFIGEFFHTSYNQEQEAEGQLGPNLTYEFVDKVQYQALNIRIGGRYYFSQNKTKTFFDIGTGLGGFIKYEASSFNTTRKEYEFKSGTEVATLQEAAAFLGLGVLVQDKYLLSLRRENSLLRLPGFLGTYKSNAWYLLAEYRFYDSQKSK